MILLQDNPRLFGIVPMSWSSIFDPAVAFFFLPTLFGCRTLICGPPLTAFTGSYGCISSEDIPQLVSALLLSS